MANSASSVLAIARGEIGYSRWDDPEAGTKYGRWYEAAIDRDSGNYDFGASGVPYCAMFVSWVFNQAGASCAGIPGAYCPSILAIGKSKGRLVPASGAVPGDVVLFDWGGDGTSDHVGIVEINKGGYLQTVEGNTNNGCVARRTRAYSTVSGVIRPAYDGSAKPSGGSSGSSSSAPASGSIADVQRWAGSTADGVWGPRTKAALVRKLQSELNAQFGRRLAVDGVWGAKTKAACVNVRRNASGNITRVLQGALICHGYSTNGFDGVFGGGTEAAVRAYQRSRGLSVDGVAGPNTFGALLG